MALVWTIQDDIIAESYAMIGVATIAGEGGVRSHIAEASDNTGTGLLAVAAVESQEGTTHPSLSGVPYLRVFHKKIGPRKWRVTQFFGWAGDSHWGGGGVATRARFQIRTGYTEAFTLGPAVADGMPEDMNGSTPGSTTTPATVWWECPAPNDANGPRPRPYALQVCEIEIRIPYASNTPPLGSGVVSCQNCLNDNTITFLSGTAVPLVLTVGKCRFVGADIGYLSNSSYDWMGDFVFAARVAWKKQRAYRSSGVWRTEKKQCYAVADMNTAFGI